MNNPSFDAESILKKDEFVLATTNDVFGLNNQRTPEEIEEIICQYFLIKVEEESSQWMFNEFDNLFILGNRVSNKVIQKYLEKLISWEKEEVFIRTLKRCCFILLNNWKTRRSYEYCDKLITFLNGVKNNVVIPVDKTDEMRIRWIIKYLKSDEYEAMKNFAGQHLGGSPSFAKHLQSVPSSNSKSHVDNFEYVEYISHKYNYQLIKKYHLQAKEFNQKSLGVPYQNIKNDLYEYIFSDIEANDSLFDLVKDKIYQDIDNYYEGEQDKLWDSNLSLRTFNKILDKITISKEKSPSSVFMSLITQGYLSIWINILIKIILVSPHSNKYLDYCITNLIEYYRHSTVFDFEWLINMLSSIKRYTTIEIYRIEKKIKKME